MTVVDRILDLCVQRGVSMARCERECGYSNGYLRKMQGKDMPTGKLKAAADFFGVSVAYLATGERDEAVPAEKHTEKPPEAAKTAPEARFSRSMWELLAEAQKATDDDLEAVTAILRKLNVYADMLRRQGGRDAES